MVEGARWTDLGRSVANRPAPVPRSHSLAGVTLPVSLSRSRSSVARLVRAISALGHRRPHGVLLRGADGAEARGFIQDLHRWFWSKTALAGLLIALRDRLKAA